MKGFSPFDKNGDTDPEPEKLGYKDEETKEVQDKIKDSLTSKYSRDELSTGAIDYIVKGHGEQMSDTTKYKENIDYYNKLLGKK